MTSGIFVNGVRPASKKFIKESVTKDPASVSLEAVSPYGKEYDGPISSMPEGVKVSFVGPDPYAKRDFYGSITRRGNTFKVE